VTIKIAESTGVRVNEPQADFDEQELQQTVMSGQ
jgi:hypothetical protein